MNSPRMNLSLRRGLSDARTRTNSRSSGRVRRPGGRRSRRRERRGAAGSGGHGFAWIEVTAAGRASPCPDPPKVCSNVHGHCRTCHCGACCKRGHPLRCASSAGASRHRVLSGGLPQSVGDGSADPSVFQLPLGAGRVVLVRRPRWVVHPGGGRHGRVSARHAAPIARGSGQRRGACSAFFGVATHTARRHAGVRWGWAEHGDHLRPLRACDAQLASTPERAARRRVPSPG